MPPSCSPVISYNAELRFPFPSRFVVLCLSPSAGNLDAAQGPRAALEQGGWLDIRSLIGFSHDVPEYRRQMVAEMDEDTLTQPLRTVR
jgi:hypothetical protein